jgi:hypothetical protein
MWGALWAMALGNWLIAPSVIEVHHILPDDPTQWIVLLSALSVLFALMGGYLAFLSGIVLVLVEKAVWGSFGDRRRAHAWFSGGLVLAAYVAQSILIHWVSYGSLDVSEYLGQFLGIAAFTIGAWGMLIAGYKWTSARPSRQYRSGHMAWALAAAALGGCLFSFVSAARPLAPVPDLRFDRVDSAASDPPLLVIGLDGGTWSVLDRALNHGIAPTLRDLADNGTTGTVKALWPPYWSSAAWASILTGLPQNVTAVHEDLAASAPGLPLMQVPITRDLLLNPIYVVRAGLAAAELIRFTPPPRALLRGKPVWQLLHEAGVDTAVVRFRFTYPPEGQAGVVVSDWVGRDQWEDLGVRRTDLMGGVAPRSRANELLEPFRGDQPRNPKLFESLLPGPPPAKPADALLDPIHELHVASDIDERTFEVSEQILRKNPQQSFLAVYIGGLDSVEHAFWPYAFPEEFPINPPASHDVERLGRVLDRYVRYFDSRVSRLLALYATPPNVLIVSDHGQGASTSATSWRGWHTEEGVFIAAGPTVPKNTTRIKVSYYDILPTIASLKGFAVKPPLPNTQLPLVD